MNDNRKNFYFIILIFVVATAFYFFRGSAAPSAILEDGSFTVNGPEEFSWTAPLDKITSIELLESYEAGSCISGESKRGCSVGVWENSALGQHSRCVIDKIPSAIVIRTESGSTILFNMESNDTTAEFHRALAEYLEQEGYISR